MTFNKETDKLMCCGSELSICSYSAAALKALGQTGTPLWKRSGTVSPLTLRAADHTALPALISPLQTATVTRSAVPKASSALHRPQDTTLLISVCNPSERERIRGEGGRRRSPPSFSSLATSYALQTSHHLWMTLFLNRTRGARRLTSLASGAVPWGRGGGGRVGWWIDSSMIVMCLAG